MRTVWQDIRYGLRTLAKQPGFALTAVLTLALGIGANTAIFSLANVFLFRPLPVKNADRLAVVAVQSGHDGEPGQVSYLDFLDYRRESKSFAEMTGYLLHLAGLGSAGHADRLIMAMVPSNFFSMLGVKPAVGRLIMPGEGDQPGTGAVVVLGNRYWKKRFGGDPGVAGRTVKLDGHAVTVIGVVPEEFRGVYAVVEMDAYAPIGMLGQGTAASIFTAREDREMHVLGTLKPGISLKQAQSELQVIAQRLAQEYPQADQGQIVRVYPEKIARPEASAADMLPLVATVFLVMVGLVLLVACVNVANLLLARAASRQREIAVRAAMGASRMRLMRQLLTESLLLAVAGGAGGAVMGIWVCRSLESLRPLGDFPLRMGFSMDWRVFGYVSVVAGLAGILAGLGPAWRAARGDLNETLREGGRGLIGDGGRHFLRNALVTAQVAGSLIVLVAAGLFTRSLSRVESIDLGFNPNNVLNVGIDPGLQGYDQPRAEVFFRELLRRAKALPGVESASIAFSIPLGYYNEGSKVYAEGQPAPPESRVPGAGMNCVTSDYFATMRMPILAGRTFNDTDTAASPRVAIVNQNMAEKFWPHQNPIGRRFSYKGPSGPFVTVAGLAPNARVNSLLDAPGMYFYVPQTQEYKTIHVLQLRTAGAPGALAPTVEALVRELDPNLPVYDVMTMEQSLAGANGFFLFQLGASFSGALGGLGLLLAVVGVYGVVSYTASRRLHEIGIRMALGARPGGILGLVMRQAAVLVAAGIGIGVMAALAVTRLLSSMLFGVKSYDPLTFAGVAALLLGVALVACYVPARRAARTDPLAALRYE